MVRIRVLHGLTMIELLVALAIVAVLLGIGVPSFGAFIQNHRLSGATNRFVGMLHLTRSEAVKRAQRVTACVSSNQRDCAAAGAWHQGWILFPDANANGVRDADEAIIQAEQRILGEVSIVGNSTVSTYISYVASARAEMLSGALQMGTVAVCLGGQGRAIVINAAGRPRVEARAC